ADRLKADAQAMAVEHGVVRGPDGRQVSYGDIVRDDPALLKRDVSHLVRPKRPDAQTIVGKSVPRIDLPDKVMARAVFLQDMRLPRMVFGRVVRPPSPGARLEKVDESQVRAMPG